MIFFFFNDTATPEIYTLSLHDALLIYGNTLHAFTNPEANAPEMGAMYQADADRRSRQALENFLAEVLA